MTEFYEKESLIKHLQHRLYECAMNNEGEAAEVFAECAKNRVPRWLVDAPTADVVNVIRVKNIYENGFKLLRMAVRNLDECVDNPTRTLVKLSIIKGTLDVIDKLVRSNADDGQDD